MSMWKKIEKKKEIEISIVSLETHSNRSIRSYLLYFVKRIVVKSGAKIRENCVKDLFML